MSTDLWRIWLYGECKQIIWALVGETIWRSRHKIQGLAILRSMSGAG